jgi:hypothetical protein
MKFASRPYSFRILLLEVQVETLSNLFGNLIVSIIEVFHSLIQLIMAAIIKDDCFMKLKG